MTTTLRSAVTNLTWNLSTHTTQSMSTIQMTQTDADAHLFCCPRCHAYFDFCASVGRVTLENVLNCLPELRVAVRVTAWVTRSYTHQLTTITRRRRRKKFTRGLYP